MRKWPPATRLFAAVSLAFGLAAFLIVRAEVARVEALRPGEPVQVVEAAYELASGTRIDASMLRSTTVPSAFVPPAAFSSVHQAVGRSLLAPIAAGEIVTRTRTGRIGGGPIASLVPAGLRAFSLAVDPSMAQGLRPGDRVDIYATYTSGAPHTEAVVGGAQVIAVSSASGDQFSSSDGAAGSFLEILVAADQASRLAYAEAFAKISLAVAGPDDPIPEQSPSVGVATPPP